MNRSVGYDMSTTNSSNNSKDDILSKALLQLEAILVLTSLRKMHHG
ncbi:MAG TPA: hypothetical protein VE076_09985 [Nitrososphaeraceae archaeon]|nr:hypothetical protein [Nitrososphaeraceae archaeon]